MTKYFCEYCGTSQDSIKALTAFKCSRHPEGTNKGYHKLYEGSEKKQYSCKYCGTKMDKIAALTAFKCSRHPNGSNKGLHSPAL